MFSYNVALALRGLQRFPKSTLLTVLTVALGLAASMATLARLRWTWLPIGAMVTLILGQLAVLGPALRAAFVPPVVATRAV
jgi:hypothetical protein